ncbi:hypothetical protein TeGR_g6783, partial [Tetraparma gracilis]
MSGFGMPAPASPDSPVPLPPTADGVSCLSWSPSSNLLAASSWDGTVRIWEVAVNPPAMAGSAAQWQTTPKAESSTPAGPVLSCCWSDDGSTVFCGGSDTKVWMWNLAQGTTMQQVGQHAAPVKAVCYAGSMRMVISGSWDKTVKFWNCTSPTPAGSFTLPERVYSMSAAGAVLAVACAARKIVVFSLNNGAPQQQLEMESPLKYQSRVIS